MAGKGVTDAAMEEMTKAMKQLQASQQALASRVESNLEEIESKLTDLQYDVNLRCSCGDVVDELGELEKNLLGTAPNPWAYSEESKVYELRFYTFNLKGKGDFKELHEDREFWKMRQSFSRVVGIWETELKGSTEFFHFVEYDNLEQLFQARKALADSKEFWPKAQKVVEQYGTFRNCLTVLDPTTPQLRTQFTPSDTAVYELQTMRRNDSTPSLGKDGALVGRFHTVYGIANTEYRLIRFPDAQAAEDAAKDRMRNEYEMKTMIETRLMVPMPVSDLQ